MSLAPPHPSRPLRHAAEPPDTPALSSPRRRSFPWPLVVLAAAVVVAVTLRCSFFPVESGDYRTFLDPWYTHLAESGFAGLRDEFVNYNTPRRRWRWFYSCASASPARRPTQIARRSTHQEINDPSPSSRRFSGSSNRRSACSLRRSTLNRRSRVLRLPSTQSSRLRVPRSSPPNWISSAGRKSTPLLQLGAD